jgi:hypothetical protein
MKTKFIAVAAFVTLLASCGKDKDTTVVVPTTSGFEDVAISDNSYYNGDESKTNFVSSGVTFQNSLKKESWGDNWSGFSVSNINNVDSAGSKNQYATYAGTGANGTRNYSISRNNSVITLPDSVQLQKMYVTNSTYAALAIQQGSQFSKAFGTVVKDSSGNVIDDGQDWFLLTIKAKSLNGSVVKTVDFYLADYRNGKTEVIKDWTALDFSEATGVKTIEFSLTSSDTSQWGINTPAYFAIDEISYTK